MSNQNPVPVVARIELTDSEGLPFPVLYEGALTSTITGAVAPFSTRDFVVSDRSPNWRVGSAEITSTAASGVTVDTAKVSASFVYHIEAGNIAGTVSTSVDATPPVSSYLVGVHQDPTLKTGFAGKNTSTTPISLEFTLNNADGSVVATATPAEWQNIPPKWKKSMYLDQIFNPDLFGASFTGTMSVRELSGNQFSIVALEQYQYPDNVTVAAIPVSSNTVTEHARIYIPQVVSGTAEKFGVGYNMRFNLTNTHKTKAERGILRFFANGPDGTAVPAKLKFTTTSKAVESLITTVNAQGALRLEALGSDNPLNNTVDWAVYEPITQPYGTTSTGTELTYDRGVSNLLITANYGVLIPGMNGDLPISVPTTEPTTNGRIAVQSISGVYDAGVAFVNTTDKNVTANLALRTDGAITATGTLTFKPGEHKAAYLWQWMPTSSNFTGTLEFTADGALAYLGLRQSNEREDGKQPNPTLASTPPVRLLEDQVTLALHAMEVAGMNHVTGSTTFYATDPATGNRTSATSTNGQAVITIPRGRAIQLDYTNNGDTATGGSFKGVYPDWLLVRNYLRGEDQAVSDPTKTATITPSNSGNIYLIKINNVNGEPIVDQTYNGQTTYMDATMTKMNFQQAVSRAGIRMKTPNGLAMYESFSNPSGQDVTVGKSRARDVQDFIMENSRGTYSITYHDNGQLPSSNTIQSVVDLTSGKPWSGNFFVDYNTGIIDAGQVHFGSDTYSAAGPVTWDALAEEYLHLWGLSDTTTSTQKAGLRQMFFSSVGQPSRIPLNYTGKVVTATAVEFPQLTKFIIQ